MKMSNSNHSESFVLFGLAGNTCAVQSDAVQSVEMVEHVTAVPNALPFVEGLIFVRGRVIPGVNLRIRLGLPRIPRDLRARMLVIRLLDGCALPSGFALSGSRFASGLHSQPLMSNEHTAGMLVDSAREFISIPADAIEPTGETDDFKNIGFSARYLKGIATLGNRRVLILNLEEIIGGV
jgi:purine-binding chemotaxis protein CheW